MDYYKQRKFAEDLSTILEDPDSLAYYDSLTQKYSWLFLRKTAAKVINTPNIRNKGAYFNTLVQMNGKKFRLRPPFEQGFDFD